MKYKVWIMTAQYLARIARQEQNHNTWVLAMEWLKAGYGLRGRPGFNETAEILDGNYTRS